MNPLKKHRRFENKLNERLDEMAYKPSDNLWDKIEKGIQTDSFEPALRGKLDQYSQEPSETVWEFLEAELVYTRKRRRIIWCSLSSLILIGSLTALFWPLNLAEQKLTSSTSPKNSILLAEPNRSNPKRDQEKRGLNQNEITRIALNVLPDQATLVPERREEVTTEGGLDVKTHFHRVRQCVDQLQGAGILVSLFIDPDVAQIEKAKELGVEAIELHTGGYAEAKTAELGSPGNLISKLCGR